MSDLVNCPSQIDCLIKLSGMPDLTLTFINPRLLDDVSFHPCVRFKRWEVSQPRDSRLRMCSYFTSHSILVSYLGIHICWWSNWVLKYIKLC